MPCVELCFVLNDKSSMVWPHWHCERCGTIGCGIPRQIWNAIKKWEESKRNEKVLGRTNNQTFVVGPTQEQRCAHTTSKGTSTKKQNKFILM